MATEEFNSGDIVYLKSGGPKMVVINVIDDSKSIHVSWITDGGKMVMYQHFPPICLTKTEPRRTS